MRIADLRPEDVAGICDHTFLDRPESYRHANQDPLATYDRALHAFVERTLAMPRRPYAVCVRAEETARVHELLTIGCCDRIELAAVVGFPLGDLVPAEIKVAETRSALAAGAREIDTVIPWDALRRGREAVVRDDLAAVVAAAHAAGAIVKAILEVCELTDAQIAAACRICAEVGADFVKTSTGFARAGANENALKIMRENFTGGIKISGGVKAGNFARFLAAVLGPEVDALDPRRVRIGESSLLATS